MLGLGEHNNLNALKHIKILTWKERELGGPQKKKKRAALLYRYIQRDVNCLAFHSCSLKNEPALRQHPSPIYLGLRITAVHFSCSDTAMHSREYPQVQTHSH